MEERRFIAYRGGADIHDGVIAALREAPGHLEVDVETVEGKVITVSFTGVHRITANRPIGMLLYSLSEMESSGPGRTFVFTNWDEEDDAGLEILAETFSVTGEGIAV